MKKLLVSSGQRLVWVAGYCLAPITLVGISVIALTGCGTMPKTRQPQVDLFQDMRKQEKFKPQHETPLFADGRTSRRPPENTVARGYLMNTGVMMTGMESETMYAGKNPVAIDAKLLEHGQTKYNVYCAPCHDRAGTGKGPVALKAPTFLPTNLHDDRLKKASDGEIFAVITNGKRSMPPYKYQIDSVHDRWAIVAYVRAVQRMSSGTIDDVPAEMRTGLAQSKSQSLLPPPPPPPAPAAGQPGAGTPAAPAAAPAGGTK